MRTKDEIRREVWELLQKKHVARFPGAEGRIPNFIGAEACATLLAGTLYWRAAKVVKINPDSPQRALRQRALAEDKTIYMPVPRLRNDKPFIELDEWFIVTQPRYRHVYGLVFGQRSLAQGALRRIGVDLHHFGSAPVERAG